MSASRKWLVPFLCAFVACPGFIFLHELGHYVTLACLGASVELHYVSVSGSMPSERFTWHADVLQTSAGPLVNATLAVVGFLWLHGLRAHRREAAPSLTDWLATSLALNAGRWLRGFTGPPGHPQPQDEAHLSQAIGLAAWFLPYLLALSAVLAVIATVRLHPPQSRLLPFFSAGLGGVLGILLWIGLAGPLLLP